MIFKFPKHLWPLGVRTTCPVICCMFPDHLPRYSRFLTMRLYRYERHASGPPAVTCPALYSCDVSRARAQLKTNSLLVYSPCIVVSFIFRHRPFQLKTACSLDTFSFMPPNHAVSHYEYKIFTFRDHLRCHVPRPSSSPQPCRCPAMPVTFPNRLPRYEFHVSRPDIYITFSHRPVSFPFPERFTCLLACPRLPRNEFHEISRKTAV